MTTPVLRSSTAPLPGRPDGTPFGHRTLQAVSHESTLVGDLVLVITAQCIPDATSSGFSIRSGYNQLLNFPHIVSHWTDGALGIAWKLAEQPGVQTYQAFDSTSQFTDARTALRVYQAGTFDPANLHVSLGESFSDGNLAPNPPAVADLEAARDYIIEAIGAWFHIADLVDCQPGAPSGFGNLIQTIEAGWAELAVANQAVSGVSSFNPGAFTDNVSSANNGTSVAVTVAISGSVSQRRGIITQAELEVTEGNLRRGVITQAEVEVPDPANVRRGVITQAELQVPDYQFPGQISFLFNKHFARYRYNVGNPGSLTTRRGVVSQAMFEVPDRVRRGIITHAALEAPSPVSPSSTVALGVYPWDSTIAGNGYSDYEAWLQRTLDSPSTVCHTIGEDDSWRWLTNPGSVNAYHNWQPYLAARPSQRLVISIQMVPFKAGQRYTNRDYLGEVAAGTHDAKIRTFADYWWNIGLGGTANQPVYFAPGIEFGGLWFPHGVKDGWDDDGTFHPEWMDWYKNAFRQFVLVMRARQPQANWKFVLTHNTRDFDPAKLGLQWAEDIYPGDDVVDSIGGDFYDNAGHYQGNPTTAKRQAAWDEHHLVALTNQNTHAVAHGKPQHFCEWGNLLEAPTNWEGGGDNPLFITNTANWIKSHNFLFANHFDVDYNPGLLHQLSHPGTFFPNSRDAFIAAFRNHPHPGW